MKNYCNYYIASIFFFILVLLSCRKDTITTDPGAWLQFSTDTLMFDTVFTTVGSTTNGFLIYNNNDAKIRVSSINIAGGSNSPYRINVDGIVATNNVVEDIEIWPGDSLYVFVEVTLDPNNTNLPLVIEDTVQVNWNGNTENIMAVAWGQDAYFLGPNTTNGYLVGETGDTTWTSEKPIVIYDGIIVPPNRTLTISPGTQVHIHNDGILYVQGTLNVQGGVDSSDWVIFQGTRLESWYDEVPGQWGGIHLLAASTNNTINNAIIKNAIVGVRVDSLPVNLPNPNLSLYNVTIKNMYDAGILGITSVIAGANCVIHDCGRYNIQLEYGGISVFGNSTFYNSSTRYIDHKNPIIRIANYLPTEENILVSSTDVQLYNCLIYGSEDEEIQLDDYLEGTGDYNVLFDHCILKTEISADTSAFQNCLVNPNLSDTLFVNAYERDLRLHELSPAINAGLSNYLITLGSTNLDLSSDRNSVLRNDDNWDIGAYEYVE